MKKKSHGRGLNSPAFYNKRKKKIRVLEIFWAVVILLFLSLIIWTSRQERFLITDISITGKNGVTGKEEVTKKIEDLISGNYLWLIPRKNILIYPRRLIEMSLLESIPKLKSVDLKLEDSRVLTLEVEEREPFALYCPNVSELRKQTQTGECFFLDEEGFIFARAPSFSGDVYFIYATSKAIENPPGKQFMGMEDFDALVQFLEKLAVLNIETVSFEARDNERSILTSSGAEILWGENNDLSVIYANLEAFLTEDSIRKETNFLNRILYLDLRTKNKVFYKFKN